MRFQINEMATAAITMSTWSVAVRRGLIPAMRVRCMTTGPTYTRQEAVEGNIKITSPDQLELDDHIKDAINVKKIIGDAYVAKHGNSDFRTELYAFQARAKLTDLDPSAITQAVTFKDINFPKAESPSDLYKSRDTPSRPDNSKLLKFGTTLLDSISYEYVIRHHPKFNTDITSRFIESFTCDDTCMKAGTSLGLQFIVQTTVDDILSLRSGQAFKSVLAVTHLELGAERARNFVIDHIVPIAEMNIDDAIVGPPSHVSRNDMTALCRLASLKHFYKIIHEAGRHTSQPTFVTALIIGGFEYSRGTGMSIKASCEDAARHGLLQYFKNNDKDDVIRRLRDTKLRLDEGNVENYEDETFSAHLALGAATKRANTQTSSS